MLALGDVECLAERGIQIVVAWCALTADASGAETGGRLFAIRTDAIVGIMRASNFRYGETVSLAPRIRLCSLTCTICGHARIAVSVEHCARMPNVSAPINAIGRM